MATQSLIGFIGHLSLFERVSHLGRKRKTSSMISRFRGPIHIQNHDSIKHFSFSVLSGPTSFLFSRAVCLSLLGRFKCRCLLLSNLLVRFFLSFFLPLIVGQIQIIGVSVFLICWFHSVYVFAWFQN